MSDISLPDGFNITKYITDQYQLQLLAKINLDKYKEKLIKFLRDQWALKIGSNSFQRAMLTIKYWKKTINTEEEVEW